MNTWVWWVIGGGGVSFILFWIWSIKKRVDDGGMVEGVADIFCALADGFSNMGEGVGGAFDGGGGGDSGGGDSGGGD